MALTVDAVSSGTGAGTSLTISHVNAGDLLVVNIGAGTSDVVTGVTFNSVAMTRTGVRNNGNSTAYQYYLLSPSIGTFNYVISVSSSLGFIGADAVSLKGAKQSGQPDATATTASGPGTTCANAVTSIANNCVHVAAFQVDSVGISSWTNGTQIATGNGAYSNPLLITPAGLQTITANSLTNNTWAAVGGTYAPLVTSIKTIDGLANASVKTVDALARASVKTWNGLA